MSELSKNNYSFVVSRIPPLNKLRHCSDLIHFHAVKRVFPRLVRRRFLFQNGQMKNPISLVD